jgi:class 3 adenylate cyclase/tetratricopeptide (TPR) repeat protein
VGDESADVVAYLPAFLVRAVSAHPSRGLPWCHEVEGTMVMADLSGFTALSEQLAKLGDEGAERLTSVINSFFEKMLKTAARYGGDTLAFGGDAILLLFDGKEHAARAVAASLEMLRQVGRSAAVEGGDGRVRIGMSVGAHSDTFVLGAAGLADERAHLFVLGRGAEMTALAEAEAERGQLTVSQSTQKLLSGRVKTTRAGDFWRVDECPGERLRRGSVEDPSASRRSPAAERSLVPEQDLQLLAPFLPPYARADGRGGGGRVQHEPEHRRTVITFVNILGLNDVIASEGVDAALVQLQSYSAMLSRLAVKHHGFVVSSDIATRGSKLVITFGTPVAHEYAPANAARFALDLTEGLRQSRLDLRHKIGLNGGHVFAGEVGPSFRRQYTVMGDAVNLAARLMSAARLGEALISRKLLDYVSPDLCARELEPIAVKGKERPVRVCVLEGPGGPSGRVPGGEAAVARTHGGAAALLRRGRLFGRGAELDAIRDGWGRARRGQGCTILIEGEPGIGKTRLLDEALREIVAPGAARGGLVTRAACVEHLQAAPYTPWIDVLLAVFGIARDQCVEDRTQTVGTYLASRLPDMDELGSLLNPLLGVTLPQSDLVRSLDAKTRRDRLSDLVCRVVMQAGGERAHVVVLEDMQWMDESSSALVARCVGLLEKSPLLLLLTSRPSETAARVISLGVLRLVLAELTESESLAMVAEALGVAVLPAEVGDAIVAKTKGNPLFLEEVTRSLQAPSVLPRILGASAVSRAAELAALEIPDRVQGLLMSRIDRLAPQTREVLKAGSVMGRPFDGAALAGLGDPVLGCLSIETALDELVAAALVDRQGQPHSRVVFHHALVQEVAYDSLPFARRRVLHGLVGSYLEAVITPPDHGLLVHHFGRAGEKVKTRIHAAKAADAATAVFAYPEALDYLALGLETIHGRTPRDACLRSRFEELMGDSLEALARQTEAIDRYTSARRRWRSEAVQRAAGDALREISPIDDPEARDSDLCWKIALSAERGSSAYRRALRWLDRADAALPPERDKTAARILVTKCVALSRLGLLDQALLAGEEGLDLARQVGDAGLQAYALAMITHPLFGLGLLERAIETNTEAVALYAQVGDLAGQASAEGNLASCYQLTGDLEAALEHHQLSLALDARRSYATGVAIGHGNLGELLLQMGDTEGALEHLRQAVSYRDHQGVPPSLIGFALVNLARAYSRLGDLDRAEEALIEGRAVLEGIAARGLLLDAGVMDAELRLARGDLIGAEGSCAAVVTAARRMGADLSETQALCVLGRVKLAEGDAEGATPGLEACIALAERSGSDYERAQALAVLAEARAACGEGAEGCDDALLQAIRLFKKMGARYDLERAEAVRRRLQTSS